MSVTHRLNPGEAFPFDAPFWNPGIDGATRPGQTLAGGRSVAPRTAPTLIRVANTMAADNCPRFGAMQIDAPVTLPSVSEEAFKANGLTLKCVEPVAGDPFVITQEAIPYSPEIGRAHV